MPDQTISAGRPAQEPREPIRIHTSRIEDACIDKDCIEDLRVYLTGTSQQALEVEWQGQDAQWPDPRFSPWQGSSVISRGGCGLWCQERAWPRAG